MVHPGVFSRSQYVTVLLSLRDHRDIPAILKVSTQPMQRLMHVLTDAETKRPGALDRDCASEKTNTTVSLHQNNTVTEKTVVRFVYISHCLLSFKGSCKSTNTDGTKNKEHPEQFMHIYIHTYIHMYIYIYTLWIQILPEKVLNPLNHTPSTS